MYTFENRVVELITATASIETLLVLRVTLDNADPVQDIAQDLEDLTHFPERITESYPHEWHAFIKRRCKALGINLTTPDNDTLVSVLEQQFAKREVWCTALIERGLAQIAYIAKLHNTDNVSVMTSKRKKAIEAFLTK